MAFSPRLHASYYLYRLTMNGRSQTGLVGCCDYQEYYDGRIKKHELPERLRRTTVFATSSA